MAVARFETFEIAIELITARNALATDSSTFVTASAAVTDSDSVSVTVAESATETESESESVSESEPVSEPKFECGQKRTIGKLCASNRRHDGGGRTSPALGEVLRLYSTWPLFPVFKMNSQGLRASHGCDISAEEHDVRAPGNSS